MTALVIESGRHRGKRFNLPPKECVIGRQEGCAIRLTSGDDSKMHCTVKATADGLIVRDLGSRNGTFVNDLPVTGPTLVKPGDTLRIGPMTFRAVASAPKPAAAPAAAPAAVPEHGPGMPRKTDPGAARPRPAQPSADPLSEEDIAALLTEGLDGLSGDTTIVPVGAAAAAPAGSGAAPAGGGAVDVAVVQRAAAVIQRWHHDHPNGG
jgi:hypothetical protein